MTDSPSVTCPSPARTTLPLRRTDKTVVERISRLVGISAILNYSSREIWLSNVEWPQKKKRPCSRKTSSQPRSQKAGKETYWWNLLAQQSARTSHAGAVIPRCDRRTAVQTRLDVVEVRLVRLSRRQLGVQQIVFFVV